MDRTWYTRLTLILGVTFLTLWLLVPSYYSFFVLDRADRNNLNKLQAILPAWSPPAKYRLSLGLDLQGGIHMVMRVDTKTALMKKAERRGTQMVNWVSQKKLGEVTASSDPEKLLVTLTAKDPATMDAIEKELLQTFEDFSKESRVEGALTLKLNDANAEYAMTESVDQAMLVIRKRIDKWGVAEVDVRKLGNDSIQISLPGQQDPEVAKELIGITGQLEFRLVDENPEVFKTLFTESPPPAGSGISLGAGDDDQSSPARPFLEGTDRQALMEYLKDKMPAGKQVLLHCVEAPKGHKCLKYYTFLVSKEIPLTGETLTSADASRDTATNKVQVNFNFDATGARELDELTSKNVGKRMAIVLDENVVMAPNIQERIPGGSGRITLGRSNDLTQAQMLAVALRAALPAPVTAGEIRQVGASLGDELIKKGTLAVILGLALVVAFMAVYYRVSGLVADVALVLNAGLILAGLAAFGATLTLPGIAGFVLTLGIAVDANVLINERVREELRNGKSARSAVDNGYDRAFWTIFDAHVTTFIAGLILVFVGTGPVRGFATSLIIGIIASLFTSIVVTRLITTWLVHGRNASTVSV
jgi:preprotein translocase subunit SecD